MNLNKKILITGAGGFIGGHLTRKLAEMGYDVVALIRYNSRNNWGWLENIDKNLFAERIKIFQGDIRDPFCVREAMIDCNYVIHLAALISIPYSYHSPASYVETNVNGTLNVLQAARELEVERLVHTSTSEVYGTAQIIPIDEMHPLQAQSPYSATKISADQLAYSYFSSFNLPVVTVRPFNTYGPHQSLRAIIPTIITQIASNSNNIKLGTLTTTRDFNYIDDTVSGFIAALESSDCAGEVINIGSSYEISIHDLYLLICNLMEKNPVIEKDISRLRPNLSEVERLCADNSKAKKMLNWSPKHNGLLGLKIGLNDTINWYLEKNNVKDFKINLYNT